MVLDGNCLQDFLVNAGVLQGYIASFMVLLFSYYTLIVFLIVLNVLLLSMQMKLLSNLSVTRRPIFGDN